MAKTLRKKNQNEKEKKCMNSREISNVQLQNAAKTMGFLKRSDNSLSQHIQLKHVELWAKLKHNQPKPKKNEFNEHRSSKKRIKIAKRR